MFSPNSRLLEPSGNRVLIRDNLGEYLRDIHSLYDYFSLYNSDSMHCNPLYKEAPIINENTQQFSLNSRFPKTIYIFFIFFISLLIFASALKQLKRLAKAFHKP